ncbi:DUF3394 domain-containing protein, partial [Oceanospirillum sp. HFRX-1_2]
NYIVVSSLLAPVGITLGQEAGLIVPRIAVHLFVFYFGIMADVTPPVGLASFAAAAVSGGDPIRTGFVAFAYSLRTAALPFLFIFNTDLLLIDVTWVEGIQVFIISTIAMLVFTAATQGYFFSRSRLYESALLLLVAFSLFRPGFWMDRIVAPYEMVQPDAVVQTLGDVAPGTELRFWIDGFDAVGNPRSFVTQLPLGEGASGFDRLSATGVELLKDGDRLIVDYVGFDSAAEKAGFAFDQRITGVQVPVDQPPQELIYIPALGLLFLIAMIQRRRRPEEPAPEAA